MQYSQAVSMDSAFLKSDFEGHSAFAATFNSPDMTFFMDGHKGSRPSLVACCPEAQTRRKTAVQHLRYTRLNIFLVVCYQK